MWQFSEKQKSCLLENFVVVHKSMRHVLYPNPSDAEADAVARLVVLNDKLNERQAREIYRKTIKTCMRRQGQASWTFTCPKRFEFVEPHLL